MTIDGRAARPGDQLSGRERVCIDGRPVKRLRAARGAKQPSFAAYYKPSGAAASERPSRRNGGFPAPAKQGRWIPVSPPDTGAAGLVVLTTDGALANRLARRARAIEQEFAVRLLGQPTPAQLERLAEGVDLDDGFVSASTVEPRGGGASNVWYHVTLREGGSRELRALLDAAGLSVSRLIRIRYGPVKLGTLRRGQSRMLSRQESEALYALASAHDAP